MIPASCGPLHPLPEHEPREQHRHDRVERREHRHDAEQAVRRGRSRVERVPAGVEEADRDQGEPVPARAGRPCAAQEHDGPDERRPRCSGRERPATASPGSRPRASGRSRRRTRASRARPSRRLRRPASRSGRSSSEAATLPPIAAIEADRLEAADVVPGDGHAPDHRDAGRERRRSAPRRSSRRPPSRGRRRRARASRRRAARHGPGDLAAGGSRGSPRSPRPPSRARRGPNGCETASTREARQRSRLHAAEEVGDAPAEAGGEREQRCRDLVPAPAASRRRRRAGSRGTGRPPRRCARRARRDGRRPRGAARRARRRAPARPRSAAARGGRGRAGGPPRSARRRAAARARASGRRRGRAPPRAAGRRAGADGAGRARGRASRRRPCARAGRRRTSGGRPGSPGTHRSGRGSREHRARPTPRSAVVRDLADEELEEAVELVGVAAQRRASAPPGRRPARLERPHLDLEPFAEPLDAAEHAHRVALRRSARRAARRRSRRARRSGRSGRRARARGRREPFRVRSRPLRATA